MNENEITNTSDITTEKDDKTEVVGVRFRQVGKVYYFSPGKFKLNIGDSVIVETARGVELGTVKLANKRGFIESTTDRDTVWLAGTPQVFKTSLYRAAAYTALDKGIQATDDNALVEALGHRVRLVECGAQNIKITTKEDIAVAEGVLAHRAKMRAEAIADGNEV